MEHTILPIGSICSINKNLDRDTKIMIIGYSPIQYENKFVRYDYSGCLYPAGVTGLTKPIVFNAEDIVEVFFHGYETADSKYVCSSIASTDIIFKNFEQEELVHSHNEKVVVIPDYSNLKEEDVVLSTIKIENKVPVISNGFIFDENGYVVKEDTSKLKNPFHQEEPVKAVEPVVESKPDKWEIFKNIRFDENGFVIADGMPPLEEPKPIETKTVAVEKIAPVVESKPVVDSKFAGIKFDENGMVIADGIAPTEEPKPVIDSKFAGIKFDENGMVIADGIAPVTESNPVIDSKFAGIKFDENGMVIADGSTTTEETAPVKKDKFSGIKFDENGMIIAE